MGSDGYFENIEKRKEECCESKENSYNTNKLKSLITYIIKRIFRKIRLQIYLDQWILLISTKKNQSFNNYKKIFPPKTHYWADPFLISHNNNYYLFFEEVFRQTNKGHISFITLDESGNIVKPPIKIIEEPFHLSYPYIFTWQDDFYMIPESSENNAIRLYKCTNFPYDWKYQYNLIQNIKAYDSTLLFHEEKWWLFANLKDHEGTSSWDELYIFYSESPISNNWKSHILNPVISDVRRARPAGKIFIRNGILYRPSQDCSLTYGYGIRINQIIKLNEKEYQEIEVKSIEPNWDKNLKAIHTMNQKDELTVIDGIIRGFKYF